MTEPTSEAPRLQLCDVCWKVDDHPRHVVHVAADFPGAVPSDEQITALDDRTDVTASMVRAILDPTTVIRHHDCCAAAGCPTGVCGPILQAVGELKGDDLRDEIAAGTIAHLTTPSLEPVGKE